jgi:hypothetical protein
MERLQDLLSRLTEQHQLALRWFVERAGSHEPWPKPISSPWGEILVASKAKGIYKPGWSRYALSVRQTIGGPYPDRDPLIRPDGSWIYSYFEVDLGRDGLEEEHMPPGLERHHDPAEQGPAGQPDDRLGRVPLALVDQLVAGRRPEGMLDPCVQVGQRLEDAFPGQALGDRLGHGIPTSNPSTSRRRVPEVPIIGRRRPRHKVRWIISTRSCLILPGAEDASCPEPPAGAACRPDP